MRGRADPSLTNLRALADVDDPRLAGLALALLAAPPFSGPTAKDFLLELADVAIRHRDPRLRERIVAIRTGIVARVTRSAGRAELGLEAELAALVEPLRSPGRSIAALLEEVYADPGDDAPRLVLADALTLADDPRGEFIVLQLERAARGDPDPGARERALVTRHGRTWMAELAALIPRGRADTFRRGFVSCAYLSSAVTKTRLRATLTSRAWTTVERIEHLDPDHDIVLTEAPLRALQHVHVQSAGQLALLAARAEPLAAVTTVRANRCRRRCSARRSRTS